MGGRTAGGGKEASPKAKPKPPSKKATKANQDDVQVMMVVPPDGGYGWVIIFAVFLSNFIIDGCMWSFAVYLEQMAAYLKVTTTDITMITSIFQGLYYISGPFTSSLVNSCGFRAAAITGGIMVTSGYLLSTFTTNYMLVYLSFGILGGIGSGMCFLPSVIIVSYYFEKYRAIANGVALSGSNFGALAFSNLFKYLIDNFDLVTTIRIQSGIAAISIVCGILYRSPRSVVVSIEDGIRRERSIFLERRASDISETSSQIAFQNMMKRSNYVRPTASQESAISKMSATTFRSRMYIEWGDARRDLFNFKWISSYAGYHPLARRTFIERYCFACCRRSRGRKGVVRTRPLDRQDIFFSGSVIDLAARSQVHDLREDSTDSMADNCCGCSWYRLTRIIDVTLMRSPAFLLYLVNMFLYTMTLGTPYMFIIARAKENGNDPDTSNWLLPMLCIGNIFSRITAGMLSFTPWIEVHIVVALSLVLNGAVFLVSAFVGTQNIMLQFVFAFLIGYFIAFSLTLRTITILRYVGMAKLTSAFGILLMVGGFAAIGGTPLSSYIKDRTGSYNWTFATSGVIQIVAAVFVCLAEISHRRMIRKAAGRQAQLRRK